MIATSRRRIISCTLFGLVLLAGCGGPTAVVRGKVTIDGSPASDGSVNFEPADGVGPTVGAKVTDGIYEITSAQKMLPGKKKVVVRASSKTGKQVPAGPPSPPGTMMDELLFHPRAGAQPDIREVEIKDGENEFDVALISIPAKRK
jgi:hypothetical protein